MLVYVLVGIGVAIALLFVIGAATGSVTQPEERGVYSRDAAPSVSRCLAYLAYFERQSNEAGLRVADMFGISFSIPDGLLEIGTKFVKYGHEGAATKLSGEDIAQITCDDRSIQIRTHDGNTHTVSILGSSDDETIVGLLGRGIPVLDFNSIMATELQKDRRAVADLLQRRPSIEALLSQFPPTPHSTVGNRKRNQGDVLGSTPVAMAGKSGMAERCQMAGQSSIVPRRRSRGDARFLWSLRFPTGRIRAGIQTRRGNGRYVYRTDRSDLRT